MKTKQLMFAPVLFLGCLFSIAAFSQTVPGGGSECPSSYSIKRNNGNSVGICNSDAEIRITFLDIPSPQDIPSITSIEYEGQRIPGISFPVRGALVTVGKGYISYCVAAATGKSSGNALSKIPPGAKLILELTTPTGIVCRTDNAN
ncbi:MAG TPA: hypothetical protein VMY77_16475 [Chitinophagaceae bacterium]|nr:hypothetical protein [Chitinophagaceae bacterium]